jgi:hypothetical protein
MSIQDRILQDRILQDRILQDRILQNPRRFKPALDHYGYGCRSVTCDGCGKRNLDVSYGIDNVNYDLCTNCFNNLRLNRHRYERNETVPILRPVRASISEGPSGMMVMPTIGIPLMGNVNIQVRGPQVMYGGPMVYAVPRGPVFFMSPY